LPDHSGGKGESIGDGQEVSDGIGQALEGGGRKKRRCDEKRGKDAKRQQQEYFPK